MFKIVAGIYLLVIIFTAQALADSGQISPTQVGEGQITGNILAHEKLVLNAAQNAEASERIYRTLQAVLKSADPKSLMVADFFMDNPPAKYRQWNFDRVSPHNFLADCYCYLVLAAYFFDQPTYRGKVLEMLKSEQKFMSQGKSIPGTFYIKTQKAEEPSLFGAAEYAKDGLISITEVKRDTPWYQRMEKMVADTMLAGKVKSKFGLLPSGDSELNGDLLQVLPRLYWLSGDKRFREWGQRLAEAYLFEVFPANNYLPAHFWDFEKHLAVKNEARLRDHGNEAVVGLMLVYIMEWLEKSPKVAEYDPAIRRMFDNLLVSAVKDGMLYNVIDPQTLKPKDQGIVDNWGYVYGAVYNYYLITGEEKYRDAVLRALKSVVNYRNYKWEWGHYDGVADSVESAIYLVNREPQEKVFAWIDAEIKNIWQAQREDGHSDQSYLEGNFIRTSLLYAGLKSRGLFLKNWQPGAGVGAVETDGEFKFYIQVPAGQDRWIAEVRFDFVRHREFFKLPKRFVRLNEFPEWYVVDAGVKYSLTDANGRSLIFSGKELIEGVKLEAGEWSVKAAQEISP